MFKLMKSQSSEQTVNKPLQLCRRPMDVSVEDCLLKSKMSPGITPGDPLHMFGMMKLDRPDARKEFMGLPSDEILVAWLEKMRRRGTSLLSRRSVYTLADYDDQLSSTIIDWREKRALLPVAHQKEGTCYAAAAIDVVASAHHIYGCGKLPRLSVEELIDNTPVYEDGGDICESFEYMKSCGIALEKDYPFFEQEKG